MKIVTQTLGVTKYEPPAPPQNMQGVAVKPKKTNPYFEKYTDIDNIKRHPDVFSEDIYVVATEKIHGTNFRAGYVRYARQHVVETYS